VSQLRTERVVMNFGALCAVDEVSLTLERGEILGLIGPNGSGKTTTVNMITGFLKPSAGRVLVDGKDITGWSPDRIASVKVRRTFQTIRLFKALTVLENVMAAAVSAGQSMGSARRAAQDILDRLDLGWLANTRAGGLPYGQERRVEIARALVTHPHYLLLDEPAAGLNESESDDLLTTLPAITRDFGCGLLIIDHDMRLIMRLCDRLHVLNYGKTIGAGTPAQVRKNPDVIAAYLGVQS
jgi:branched-chain amino acid transport system ATP-binding protein